MEFLGIRPNGSILPTGSAPIAVDFTSLETKKSIRIFFQPTYGAIALIWWANPINMSLKTDQWISYEQKLRSTFASWMQNRDGVYVGYVPKGSTIE